MSFRGARIKAEMSVLNAAKALGVTDAAVYQWETGMYIPTGKRLPEIAKLYGVTVDELLKQDGDEVKAERRCDTDGRKEARD